jgi:hypothetical protein
VLADIAERTFLTGWIRRTAIVLSHTPKQTVKNPRILWIYLSGSIDSQCPVIFLIVR